MSFWDIFCPIFLGHYWSLKIKNWKKSKKTRDIILLHKCTKNYDHMLYCSWDKVGDECNCCFSLFDCPFTRLTVQKSKFLQNEKYTWRYHHFTQVYQIFWSDDVRFLRYEVWQMDRDKLTDRRTEKVTNRGRCPT